ncbi:MAG: serine/threonine protein kinase, partial [Myxococcales bacterium]|nr:serine/threonine protein kinase [Myxococcales bacterium]
MSGATGIGSTRGAWALADDAVLAAVKARILGEVEEPPRLGRYELEGPLGAGAMGRILLARDRELQRRVALKLIAPELADDPTARIRIVREARAMAKLSDPHVAQVYEVVNDDEHLFVVMEYVDGTRLRTWLEERPRPWREVVAVLVQAGRGLAAAHAKGLAHRDFKPDNVVLQTDGRAKVVDFGLARDFGESELERTPDPDVPATLTATGAWLGTPAYMAPEQWEGGRVDARSDQFSFCVALYEALSGRRPFEGETAAEVRAALGSGRVPPLGGPSRIPRRIEAAILRGLRADPAERWPSMEPLLRALAPRARARAMVLIPVVAVVGTAAGAMLQDDRCDEAGAAMDAVWNDEARARSERAMVEAEAEAPWAVATGEVQRSRLELAAEAWRRAARAECAAGGEATEPARCLAYARARLEEAVERAASHDPAVLVGAAADAELLTDARACLQPSAVAWLHEHPQVESD